MVKLSQLTKLLSGEKDGMGDVATLIRRYIIQETLVPLKRLGRAIAFSLAGALLVGIGGIIVLVGVLRLLQTETGGAFDGNWSFAPYFLTVCIALGLIGASAVIGFRRSSSSSTRGEE